MSWLTTYKSAQGESSISIHKDNSKFPSWTHLCKTINFPCVLPSSYATVPLRKSCSSVPPQRLKDSYTVVRASGFWWHKEFKCRLETCFCRYFCPGGNRNQNTGFQKGAKEESSSVCSETCSYPSNKANLIDFKAGRTAQKFHYFVELAAVLLMFTRHTEGGVEKGIVG